MRIITGIMQVAGLSSLGYGLWQYEPWVAWVACGTIIMIGGVVADLMILPKQAK